ncbi:Cytochrome-c oxidase [Hyphomicrobium sp. 1Nfss2.1]
MWLAVAGAVVIALLSSWTWMELPPNDWVMLAVVVVVFALGGWLQFRGERDQVQAQSSLQRIPGAPSQRIETIAFFASGMVPYFVGLAVWGLTSDLPLIAALAGISSFVVGYVAWLQWSRR